MSIATAYAEHFAFQIGENRASFGIGFGWTEGGHRGIPAVNALVERSIIPFRDFGFLSVGAQFGFHYGFNRSLPSTYTLPGRDEVFGMNLRHNWTSFYFVPRLALYFHEVFHPDDFPENIDLYVGVGIGFNHLSHRILRGNLPPDATILNNDTGFRFAYQVFIGGRHYFRENMAVFAEIGYGLSFLNLGITIRY